MTVTLQPEVERLVNELSRRSGESADAVANRALRDFFAAHDQPQSGFIVKPLPLEFPEKWKDLTARQIIDAMDLEEYEEKLDRDRHEPADLRL